MQFSQLGDFIGTPWIIENDTAQVERAQVRDGKQQVDCVPRGEVSRYVHRNIVHLGQNDHVSLPYFCIDSCMCKTITTPVRSVLCIRICPLPTVHFVKRITQLVFTIAGPKLSTTKNVYSRSHSLQLKKSIDDCVYFLFHFTHFSELCRWKCRVHLSGNGHALLLDLF